MLQWFRLCSFWTPSSSPNVSSSFGWRILLAFKTISGVDLSPFGSWHSHICRNSSLISFLVIIVLNVFSNEPGTSLSVMDKLFCLSGKKIPANQVYFIDTKINQKIFLLKNGLAYQELTCELVPTSLRLQLVHEWTIFAKIEHSTLTMSKTNLTENSLE